VQYDPWIENPASAQCIHNFPGIQMNITPPTCSVRFTLSDARFGEMKNLEVLFKNVDFSKDVVL